MSRRVSISMGAARALYIPLLAMKQRGEIHPVTDLGRAFDELQRAMKPKRKAPDAAGLARAAELKARANATRRAFGLHPLVSKPRKPSKEERRESRASIRETLIQRAGGICECGCRLRVTDGDHVPSFMEAEGQVDHVFGRGRGRLPESVETCWFIRRECHHQKTNNRPDAETWWQKFIDHLHRNNIHGAVLRAALGRLVFVKTRASLPAAPKVRHVRD